MIMRRLVFALILGIFFVTVATAQGMFENDVPDVVGDELLETLQRRANAPDLNF